MRSISSASRWRRASIAISSTSLRVSVAMSVGQRGKWERLEPGLGTEAAGELGAQLQVLVGDLAGGDRVALLERGDEVAVVLAHRVARRREVREQGHEA